MALEKAQVKAAFGRVQEALEKSGLGNAPKQLLQVRAIFALGDNEPELTQWNLILDNATAEAQRKNPDATSVSHGRFIKFIANSGRQDYGHKVLAYLMALLGNDVSKRTMLTVHVLSEVLEELEMSYTELVEHTEVSSDKRCMTQEYFDAMQVVCNEFAKVQGQDYTCLRDIFSKGKAEDDVFVELDI
jgi:hypothetical protein